jgi:cell division protein FtsI (penicillin-binding protein 3)
MRGRRKRGKGKLIAALALMAIVAAAALLVGTARMPEPDGEDLPSELVPVGTVDGRKNIYDRRLRELAVSLKLTSVYARPLELQEPEVIAGELAVILERNERELLSALNSERSFVWLGRRLEPEKSERISGLKAKGIYLVEEEQRFYPNRETAAHVLGFLSNEQGLAGIEYYYEQLLQGGWGLEQKLPGRLSSSLATEKGVHLVLTLDLSIQAHVERELARLQKATGAAAATALVMDPANGEIHAMVSLPAFDPNLFWKYNTAAHSNRVLTDPIFPSGLWNLFRLAAAVDAGREIPEREAGRAVSDRPMGATRGEKKAEPPHADWVELSAGGYVSPAVARYASFKPAADDLNRFARKLDLSAETGIDLPRTIENGLASGNQPVAEGQEMNTTVTALQLLAAFNRLISISGTGSAHLLKGHMAPEQEPVARVYEHKLPVVGIAANQAILALLRDEGGADLQAGVVESLSAHQVSEVSTGETGDSQCRYQNVLLGLSPGASPLSLLMVLDGVCIDVNRPSALRISGKRLAKQLKSLSQEGASRPIASGKRSDEEIHRQWRQLHDLTGESAEKPIHREQRMPDLRGNSLRQALRTLQPYGIRVDIAGNGRVVGQQPKAGRPLNGVLEIRLELRAENE